MISLYLGYWKFKSQLTSIQAKPNWQFDSYDDFLRDYSDFVGEYDGYIPRDLREYGYAHVLLNGNYVTIFNGDVS